MLNRKVLVVVITKDIVEPGCMASVLGQDYPDFQVMTLMTKAKEYGNPTSNKYINASDNRNQAAKLALASDADWFLLVDSDTVIPPHTISELIIFKRPIVAGWYKTLSGVWIACRIDKDGKLAYFESPVEGLLQVDVVGLGCCLVSREVLAKVPFEDGLDTPVMAPDGKLISMGDCAKFGMDTAKAGFPTFISGSVICEHLKRGESNAGTSDPTPDHQQDSRDQGSGNSA